jgi:small-conductance mechanosensitive channel
MGLSWRDGIATILIAAGVAVTGSLVNAWAWPLIGDARAGVVAVFILGFAACVVGGGPAWMFAAMREGRMRGPGEIWSPFFVAAAALGALAFALMFADLFINDVSLLIWATVTVVAVWFVTTIHHALETGSHRVAGAGPRPA